MAQQYDSWPEDFIPARESKLFMRGFKWYVRWLFYRRFDRIWLRQEYHPQSGVSTIYYLNHTSWWDGLIPFLLNEFEFRQRARAIMEDQQMREFPFFSRIGAFSIDRSNARSALHSLKYGLDSLQPGGRSLFIYPEGKIRPTSKSPAAFEGGLAWLATQFNKLDNPVNIVPVGIYIHTMLSDRPQLMLNVAQSASISTQKDRKEITAYLHNQLADALSYCVANAQQPDDQFRLFP